MRSLRTDMIDFELEAETQREREGERTETNLARGEGRETTSH